MARRADDVPVTQHCLALGDRMERHLVGLRNRVANAQAVAEHRAGRNASVVDDDGHVVGLVQTEVARALRVLGQRHGLVILSLEPFMPAPVVGGGGVGELPTFAECILEEKGLHCPRRSTMAVAKEQDEIFRAALSLPEEVRVALAEQLLESLDSPDQREIDARWAKEAEDRIDAYDRGEIVAFPIDEVFSSLHSRLKK
jgi:putative addiction module component (TIGR02574 family)